MVVAMDYFLPDSVIGIERFIEIGASAAEEAMFPLIGVREKVRSIDVIVGLPANRPGLGENVRQSVVGFLQGCLKDSFHIQSLCGVQHGHSAGLMAMSEGCRSIRELAAEFSLVGGIDSYVEPETLEWLDDQGQLHSKTNGIGFIPGEGAGFCLLCSEATARRHKLKIFGRVLAVTTEYEKHLIKTDSVCLGQGLSTAFEHAFKKLPKATKIDFIICDLNGEPYRGDEFSYTIVRTSDQFVDPAEFLTPADCWGDVGAASGPLFINLALIAATKGYSKGPHTLVWTSSEGGERSVAIIQT